MPRNLKTERLRKLTADLHQEIGQAETIADEQLERNIERARALLRGLSEERERRAERQALRTRRLLGVDAVLTPKPVPELPVEALGQLPKRDGLVLALEKIGVASPPARVAAIVRALFGLVISTSQFASFRKADERSYRRAPRNRVYIVPALSAADLSAMAGMVALSNWPIERRIIGGYSQRVDALRGIAKAYAIYRDTKDSDSAAIIRIIGRELPSIGQYAPDIDAMGKAAAADLAEFAERDEEERHGAAARLANMDARTQMFGKAPLLVVGAERP
jgi:hypothetical protein